MERTLCEPEWLARTYAMKKRQWVMCHGEGPVVAAAIHDGHDISVEVAQRLAIDDSRRLREEDPVTYRMTSTADNRITVTASRFLVDLNRPREKAVYRTPQEAWGMQVWREPPTPEMVDHSLAIHDRFYRELFEYLNVLRERYGRFVVLDLHSYNHRRNGPDAPPEDPKRNPDVNIGTATLRDRPQWEGLIERVLADMRAFDYFGRNLDVRENVKFKGGYMAEWIHRNFEGSACVLSVEFKKFFMDEWTGNVDLVQVERLHTLLKCTIPGIETSLLRMGVEI